MMNKKLSIIVPVYNGERYVKSCLSSIVTQLQDEVEIIVINDGSTDATDHIITTEFKSFIDNGSLNYFSTANSGVSAARNLGLENASGEYVAFVDADDIVSPVYVITLIEAMIDSPSVIEFGYRTIDQHGKVLKDRSFANSKFGIHPSKKVINSIFASCLWYPFLRVFSRDLFSNIRFPVGVRFCEDLMTLSTVYKQSRVIYTLPSVLYDYRINPAGATLNIKPDYAISLISYYRKIAHDQSFANMILKINLGYVIRRCIAETTDPLGRMPSDIESDIRSLIFTPSLFFKIRIRFVVYALWGSAIYSAKKFFNKITLSKKF